jgi:hypothetical protein
MADPSDSREDGAGASGIDRARTIISELAEALAAAAAALMQEQGVKAAAEISAVAEAARCAARSLDGSDHPGLAGGVDRAGDRLDDIARVVRERDWRHIAAETADFARRRPGLFGLGAMSFGFVAGRLLLPRADPDRPPAEAAGNEATAPADRSEGAP